MVSLLITLLSFENNLKSIFDQVVKVLQFMPYPLGYANKDLWALCTPIFIIVVYCRTATTYFLEGKE